MVTQARRPTRGGAAKPSRSRDRLATRDDILAAVGRLLARDGFGSVGINAIAREAGVDKVLIYRYFGGLDALLEAWGHRNLYGAGSLRAVTEGTGMTAADRAAAFLSAYVRDLRMNPEALEVSRWELVEDNPLTRRLARTRETAGLAELDDLGAPARLAEELDLPSVAAIITAGILHLALRARTAPEWLGVPLRTEKGWARIERAAVALARAAIGPTTP
jgi:AcrR family transcriptional regulator